MAKRFEGADVEKAFKEAFGMEIEDITPQQMRFMISLAKHVRFRCRSNAALHAYLKRTFSGLKFQEVPREFDGKKYTALEITSKKKADLPPVIEDDNEE